MCAYIVATRNIERTKNQLYSLCLFYKLEFVMRWTVSQRFVAFVPTSLHKSDTATDYSWLEHSPQHVLDFDLSQGHPKQCAA